MLKSCSTHMIGTQTIETQNYSLIFTDAFRVVVLVCAWLLIMTARRAICKFTGDTGKFGLHLHFRIGHRLDPDSLALGIVSPLASCVLLDIFFLDIFKNVLVD